MGFDWGSFLGALIGSSAAFAAAYFSFWLQRRASRLRGAAELRNKTIWTCRESQLLIHRRDSTADGLMKVLRSIRWNLEDLIPLANEVDILSNEIHDTLQRITDSLSTLIQLWDEPHDLFMAIEETNTIETNAITTIAALYQMALEIDPKDSVAMQITRLIKKVNAWIDRQME